jgi:hypothetical protein
VLRWEPGLSGKAVRKGISAGVWTLSMRSGFTAPKISFGMSFKISQKPMLHKAQRRIPMSFMSVSSRERIFQMRNARDDEDGELEEGEA